MEGNRNIMKIKNLLLALVSLVLLAVAASSFADTVKTHPPFDVHRPKSFNTLIDSKGVGFTYLNDGHRGMGSLNLDLVGTFGGKFALNQMTVVDPANGTTQLYVGLGLTYKVYDHNGFGLSAIAGYKGLRVSGGFGLANDHPLVLGFQLTAAFTLAK